MPDDGGHVFSAMNVRAPVLAIKMPSRADHHPPTPAAISGALQVLELRQYTLHPSTRDTLIELFDRELIEPQEALNMTVVGQFRDRDDPDRFVWVRGFPDMDTRATALQTFYGGPVWKQHRAAANATMINSDNVLLVRPVDRDCGFAVGSGLRAPRDALGNAPGMVIATTYAVGTPVEDWCAAHYDTQLKPRLMRAGIAVLACCITDPTPNNVASLPTRENANVVVVFIGVTDAHSDPSSTTDPINVTDPLAGLPELDLSQQLCLIPTARSQLTGLSPPCPALAPRATRR